MEEMTECLFILFWFVGNIMVKKRILFVDCRMCLELFYVLPYPCLLCLFLFVEEIIVV